MSIDLNNKKVQYAILGALVGCGALFMLLQFVVQPALASYREDKAKKAEIEKKLVEMREVVQSGASVQEQIALAKAELKNKAQYIPLPVLGNYLLDMEEFLKDCASKSGVELISVSDHDIGEIALENSKVKAYRVRLQARAGFNELVRMVETLSASNPFLSISGMSITAQDKTPAEHDLSLVVSWLVWSDPSKRPAFLMEER